MQASHMGMAGMGSMAMDTRWGGDRVMIAGDAATWFPAGSHGGFSEVGATAAVRSSAHERRLVIAGRLDARRASAGAPMALWPGAGTGPGRSYLLRGSPLLHEGEISGAAFGRGLSHATLEANFRLIDRAFARLGLAVFADWARASDGGSRGPGRGVAAVGAGLRIRGGPAMALRLDVAKQPTQSGFVFSAGLIPPWPR